MRKSLAILTTAVSALWFATSLALQPADKSHDHRPAETVATFHNVDIQFCRDCHAWRYYPRTHPEAASAWRSGKDSFTFANVSALTPQPRHDDDSISNEAVIASASSSRD